MGAGPDSTRNVSPGTISPVGRFANTTETLSFAIFVRWLSFLILVQEGNLLLWQDDVSGLGRSNPGSTDDGYIPLVIYPRTQPNNYLTQKSAVAPHRVPASARHTALLFVMQTLPTEFSG